MNISVQEANTILTLIGTTCVRDFDDVTKRRMLINLLTTSLNVSNNVSNAVMLSNVSAKDVVSVVKTIRGLTGMGLKEAKDLHDKLAAEYEASGRTDGVYGPLSLPYNYETAVRKLAEAQQQFSWTSSIVVYPY